MLRFLVVALGLLLAAGSPVPTQEHTIFSNGQHQQQQQPTKQPGQNLHNTPRDIPTTPGTEEPWPVIAPKGPDLAYPAPPDGPGVDKVKQPGDNKAPPENLHDKPSNKPIGQQQQQPPTQQPGQNLHNTPRDIPTTPGTEEPWPVIAPKGPDLAYPAPPDGPGVDKVKKPGDNKAPPENLHNKPSDEPIPTTPGTEEPWPVMAPKIPVALPYPGPPNGPDGKNKEAPTKGHSQLNKKKDGTPKMTMAQEVDKVLQATQHLFSIEADIKRVQKETQHLFTHYLEADDSNEDED